MQPHFPFLGETGEELEHKGIEQPAEEGSEKPNPWSKLNFYGGPDRDAVLNAYYENHEIAVEHASELVEELDGKTVVTSDHANLIGEWTGPLLKRMYGHPRGFRKAELVTVPWLEVSARERKQTSSEEPIKKEEMESSVVEDRLKHLGYK